MKHLYTLCLLFIAASSASAQCYPAFSPMPVQPPSPGPGYTIDDIVFTESYGIYIVKQYRNSAPFIYQCWDGSEWTNINTGGFISSLNDPNTDFVDVDKWNGRYFVKPWGRVDRIGKFTAPSGKYFALLEYHSNAIWDTLPAFTLDTGIRINDICITSHGMYCWFVKKDDASYNGIYRYDSTSKQFTKFVTFITPAFMRMSASRDRLLIANVNTVNGTAVKGFAWIDSTGLKLNTDPAFNAYMQYSLDYVTGHIYAFPEQNNPEVLEYTDKLVSRRSTVWKDGSTVNNTVAYKGFLARRVSGNKECIAVLCPGEANWKTLREGDWKSFLYCSRSGIYVLDDNSGKTMELLAGTSIGGMAYVDADSNCSFSNGEKVLKDFEFSMQSADMKLYGRTDDNGMYRFFTAPAAFSFDSDNALSSCTSLPLQASDPDSAYVFNIPVKMPKVNDLQVSWQNGPQVRWNSQVQYVIQIENRGQSLDSAVFEIEIDPRLSVVSADIPIKHAGGSLWRGTLKDLEFLDKQKIYLDVWIDTAKTKPDSIVCSSISVFAGSDTDFTDKKDLCQKVVYSFDPNHKDCNQDKIPVLKSATLEYFIEFQNEGNDDAYDVVLRDTLEENLLPESFNITGTSHPYTASLSGSVLTIEFKNIFLKPKKQDEELSKGFFKFRIACKQGLADGNQISNKAYIYFDLNKPVITNDAVTAVSKDAVSSISVINKSDKSISLYPNPADKVLTVYSSAYRNAVLAVYDITGTLVCKSYKENDSLSLDVSGWPGGVYIIRCGDSSVKFIKAE